MITIADVRRSQHCVRGARLWFESHGFDFQDFLRHGMPAERLLATNDALAIQVVQQTMERREHG